LEIYCKEHGLNPRHDATNDDTQLIRNKVRHELIPRLHEFNPQVERTLSRMAEIIQTDDDFLTLHYAQDVEPYIIAEAKITRFDLVRFNGLHPAMRRRLMAALGGGIDVTYEHILGAIQLVSTGNVAAVWEFPNHIQMWIGYEDLLFGTSKDLLEWLKLHEILLQAPAMIHAPGVFPQGGWSLICEAEPPDRPFISLPLLPDLMLRGREAGDWLIVPGVGRQKLKEWMINHKIPRQIRDFIPCLVSGKQILSLYYDRQWIVFEFPVDAFFQQAHFFVNYL
jgi:tRNA(Ile)-lysidine synthase